VCGACTPTCSATGCTTTCTNPNIYVDVSSGNDAYDGRTPATAKKTITAALAIAASGSTVQVAPGLYNAAVGESFPIHVPAAVALVGDYYNKGTGQIATEIAGGALVANPTGCFGDIFAAVVLTQGASISGFVVTPPPSDTMHGAWGVYAIDATVGVTACSFKIQAYGAVYFQGTGGTPGVRDCVVNTNSVGVLLCKVDGAIVKGSSFLTGMGFPIDAVYAGSATSIESNVITGDGDLGVIADGTGGPTIKNNTFNNATGYTYGAIYSRSSPKIRANKFQCANGVYVENASTPDLGTAADPGGNDFSAVTTWGVKLVTSPSAVTAIGNTWKHAPPTNGGDIIVSPPGSVRWGTGATDVY
jgi:parallel beta-helix repeat protein